jgi:hypothetical protein
LAGGVKTTDYALARRAAFAHCDIVEVGRAGLNFAIYRRGVRDRQVSHRELMEAAGATPAMDHYIEARKSKATHTEVMEVLGLVEGDDTVTQQVALGAYRAARMSGVEGHAEALAEARAEAQRFGWGAERGRVDVVGGSGEQSTLCQLAPGGSTASW